MLPPLGSGSAGRGMGSGSGVTSVLWRVLIGGGGVMSGRPSGGGGGSPTGGGAMTDSSGVGVLVPGTNSPGAMRPLIT